MGKQSYGICVIFWLHAGSVVKLLCIDWYNWIPVLPMVCTGNLWFNQG